MTKIDHTYEQIASYLTGNMSDEDCKNFESWLSNASKEEKSLFEATRNLWLKTAPTTQSFAPDVDRALKQIHIKRQFRNKPYQVSWRYAAAIALLITVALSSWIVYNQPIGEIINVAQNAVEKVELPDGSDVWLSPGTSISYKNDFLDSREINLSGKAFFEVAKRNGAPFSIYSANTKTQVLGTSFNLETRDDGQVAIQVTTGKVAFSEINDPSPVFLTPGQHAQYAPKRTKKIVIGKVENENYRAWQTRKLTFNNTSIKKLFETLESYYQTEINVQEDLFNCRFTSSFENQSLEEVLEILELTGNLNISQSSNGYRISGTPCQ